MFLMDRKEALEAMKGGHKIMHEYFSPEEYLYMVNGDIKDESGYFWNFLFFKRDMYEKGWTIKE